MVLPMRFERMAYRLGGDRSIHLSYGSTKTAHVPENSEIRTLYGQVLGQAGDVFHAYLNLAYAAAYANNPTQVEFQLDKVKRAAKTDADRRELAKLEDTIKKRSEFWKKRIFE